MGNKASADQEVGFTVLPEADGDRARREIDNLEGKQPGLAVALAAEALVTRQAEQIRRQQNDALAIFEQASQELRQAREEAQRTTREAREEAQRIVAEARADAEKLRSGARQDTQEQRQNAEQEARRVVESAQRDAREALNHAQKHAEAMLESAHKEATSLRAQATQAWQEAREGAKAHYEMAREQAGQAAARSKEYSDRASNELRISQEAITHSLTVLSQVRQVQELAAKPPEAGKSGLEVLGGIAEMALAFLDKTTQTLIEKNPDKAGDLLGGLASVFSTAKRDTAAEAQATLPASSEPATSPSGPAAVPPTPPPAQPTAPAAQLSDLALFGKHQDQATQIANELASARGVPIGEIAIDEVIAELKQRHQGETHVAGV